MPKDQPTGSLIIRPGAKGPVYYAKWRRAGGQVLRKIGPAWVALDGAGQWCPRKGRPAEGHYTAQTADRRMEDLIAKHDESETAIERGERERRERGVPFREVAMAWLERLEHVKGAKPSTLRDYRAMLREPGAPFARGKGISEGRILKAFGDRGAAQIAGQDVTRFLRSLDKSLSPRNVNKHRQVLSAIFAYAMRKDAYALPYNPVADTDKREEDAPEALDYYSAEEVEALARALEAGKHRAAVLPIRRRKGESNEHLAARQKAWSDEQRWCRREDRQSAELVRVAANTGLRRGELVALRWRDVDFARHKIIVRKAMSAGREASPKSGVLREVPLTKQAAVALDRLSRREDHTAPGERVFIGRMGDPLDADAMSDRVVSAMEPAGLRALRFHDLRHTFASRLVAAGIDLASVKAAMGHAKITTTERYLHARPASELADRFSVALADTASVGSQEPVLDLVAQVQPAATAHPMREPAGS